MAKSSHTQSDHDLIQAALTALSGVQLVPNNKSSGSYNKLSVFNHHTTTYSSGGVGDTYSGRNMENTNMIEIYIKQSTDENITCQIDPTKTIEDLKKMIQKKKGISADQQRIIFAGKQLEDGATLNHYGIHNGATLHLVSRMRVEAPSTLDLSSLDPQYDYDFTNVQDHQRKFQRGGLDYVRPCGWRRFAIKVIDKYENSIWLGHQNTEGEWPVSYHGTDFNQNKTMATDGYNLTKGKRYAFGHGVYSTPDVNVAEKYAVKFSHEGNQYLIILQNRVNPEQLEKLSAAETGIGDYWISPSDKDIRPYGILIRKV